MSSRSPKQPAPDGTALISTCPLCQAAYEPQETKILGEQDDAHLLHMRCSRCGNAVLAIVLVSSVGVSSVGVMTDMTYADALKFSDAPQVDADQVLAAHTHLSDDRWCAERLTLL